MSGDGVVGGPAEECAEAWVRGWARCRGVEARARGEGWQVLVHGAAREVELVLAAPSAALAQRELAALPGLPIRTWLTLLDPPPGLRPVSGTVLREDGEVLQHLPTLPATAPDVRVSLHPEGDDVVAAQVELDGATAASGRAALIGDAVVLDSIVTARAHRRRGLGAAVVSALVAWGRGAGASRGLLVATPEGRALYTALGWRTLAVVHTYAPDPGP